MRFLFPPQPQAMQAAAVGGRMEVIELLLAEILSIDDVSGDGGGGGVGPWGPMQCIINPFHTLRTFLLGPSKADHNLLVFRRLLNAGYLSHGPRDRALSIFRDHVAAALRLAAGAGHVNLTRRLLQFRPIMYPATFWAHLCYQWREFKPGDMRRLLEAEQWRREFTQRITGYRYPDNAMGTRDEKLMLCEAVKRNDLAMVRLLMDHDIRVMRVDCVEGGPISMSWPMDPTYLEHDPHSGRHPNLTTRTLTPPFKNLIATAYRLGPEGRAVLLELIRADHLTEILISNLIMPIIAFFCLLYDSGGHVTMQLIAFVCLIYLFRLSILFPIMPRLPISRTLFWPCTLIICRPKLPMALKVAFLPVKFFEAILFEYNGLGGGGDP